MRLFVDSMVASFLLTLTLAFFGLPVAMAGFIAGVVIVGIFTLNSVVQLFNKRGN